MQTKDLNEVEELEEVFTYLDELRDSGKTNMFGARPYVMNEFGFDKKKSNDLVSKWMTSFDSELSVQERIKKIKKEGDN